jgi:hypothetical protein
MTGFGFGGSVNLSFEIYLTQDFMLSLFAEGRVASTTNIQGEFQDSNGNTEMLGLATDSQNYVGISPTTYIGPNGYKWATIDYTGGDAGIGLSIRY